MMILSSFRKSVAAASRECFSHLKKISTLGSGACLAACSQSCQTHFKPYKGFIKGSWNCLCRERWVTTALERNAKAAFKECWGHLKMAGRELVAKEKTWADRKGALGAARKNCRDTFQHYLNPANGMWTRIIDCIEGEMDIVLEELSPAARKEILTPVRRKVARYERVYVRYLVPGMNAVLGKPS